MSPAETERLTIRIFDRYRGRFLVREALERAFVAHARHGLLPSRESVRTLALARLAAHVDAELDEILRRAEERAALERAGERHEDRLRRRSRRVVREVA